MEYEVELSKQLTYDIISQKNYTLKSQVIVSELLGLMLDNNFQERRNDLTFEIEEAFWHVENCLSSGFSSHLT